MTVPPQAMRQRILGSHTPPCHRRMVITTHSVFCLATLQRRPVLYHSRWLMIVFWPWPSVHVGQLAPTTLPQCRSPPGGGGGVAKGEGGVAFFFCNKPALISDKALGFTTRILHQCCRARYSHPIYRVAQKANRDLCLQSTPMHGSAAGTAMPKRPK